MHVLTIQLSLCALLAGAAPAQAASFDPLPIPTQSVSGRQVIINVPQTRLFVLEDGKLTHVFPIAVGKSLTKTPVGEYSVTGIHRNPTWHVPASIQEEMRQSGKPVETTVPPGPANPLGVVFIRFGEPRLGLGMHGTNAPNSVPGFRSHGCVRLRNPDALKLASLMEKGVPVSVTYQPVLLNNDEDGHLWVTAFADRYQHNAPDKLAAQAKDLAERWASETGRQLDSRRLLAALQTREGKPVCVSCHPPASSSRQTRTPTRPAPAKTDVPALPDTVPAQTSEPATTADMGGGAQPAGIIPVNGG